MTTYIGIDFGTTNCLAAIVNEQLTLELIPLDVDSSLMPSVIFLESEELFSSEFSEFDFDRRLKHARHIEQERINNEEKSLAMQLEGFRKKNMPKALKPKPADFYDIHKYTKACIRYEKDLEILPRQIHHFENAIVSEEEARLRKLFRSPVSDDELIERVRYELEKEVIEARNDELKNQTFFSALENPGFKPIFGSRAIQAYSADPLSGFFMKSPKAFLGVRLIKEHKIIFEKIISLILKEIKVKAELHTNKKFDGVVLGRPVNFMSADDEGNAQALTIMSAAARRAGFNEIRFVMEPLAAALVISRTMLDTNDPALVVDIGGGTTDVAYLDVNPNSEIKLQVLGVSGSRIGGNDFDEMLARRAFGPFFGAGSNLKNGLAMPTDIFSSALSTRDIHEQAKFRSSGARIIELLETASKRIHVERLYQIYVKQLQNKLILSAENLKIKLSDLDRINQEIEYLDGEVTLNISNQQMAEYCQAELSKIQSVIKDAILFEKNRSAGIRVFLTGGMSYCRHVTEAVAAVLPAGSTMQRIPGFQSIISGLAVVARQLSRSETVFLEPESIRGVPVERDC